MPARMRWFSKAGLFLSPHVLFILLAFTSATSVACRDFTVNLTGHECAPDYETYVSRNNSPFCCPPEASDWSKIGVSVACCEKFPHKCERSDTVQTSVGSFAVIYVDSGVLVLNSFLQRYEPPSPFIKHLLLQELRQEDIP